MSTASAAPPVATESSAEAVSRAFGIDRSCSRKIPIRERALLRNVTFAP